MKQRLAIAASLLQPRELIVLDEPTNGLDPQGTREVRGLIREIALGGITVLVSCHLLAEVEQICSHVGVMRTGRLVFQGTLDELRARGVARVEVRTTEVERAAEIFGKLGLADVRTADFASLNLLANLMDCIALPKSCAPVVTALPRPLRQLPGRAGRDAQMLP